MQLSQTVSLEGLRFALTIERCGGNSQNYDPANTPLASTADAEQLYNEIRAHRGPIDMPPDPRYLRILVDATAYLHDHYERRYGWAVLGIKPQMGRRLLTEATERISWAIFFSAMLYGLGIAKIDSPDLVWKADKAHE